MYTLRIRTPLQEDESIVDREKLNCITYLHKYDERTYRHDTEKLANNNRLLLLPSVPATSEEQVHDLVGMKLGRPQLMLLISIGRQHRIYKHRGLRR